MAHRRPRRLVYVVVLSLAFLAPFLGSAHPSSGWCADTEEARMLGLINEHRAANGRPALRLSQTLGAAAEHHSVDMAEKSYFSHTLKDGTSWSQNVTNHGYTYSTYRGENLAAGRSDAAGTFVSWKNSSGHNANMLNKNYKVVGIDRAYGSTSTYKWYWTTTFGGYADGPGCVVATASSDGSDDATATRTAAENDVAEYSVILADAVSEKPPGSTLPTTGSGSGR